MAALCLFDRDGTERDLEGSVNAASVTDLPPPLDATMPTLSFRSILRSVAPAAAASLLVVACSDPVSGPRVAADHAAAMPVEIDALLLPPNFYWQYTFTVDPSHQTTVNIATHQIVFDQSSICTPSSSYGLGEWDKPCAAQVAPITITAKITSDAFGNPRIDFAPHLRFVPGTNVMLKVRDADSIFSPNATIRYCPDNADGSPSKNCYDESMFDSSVATQHDAFGLLVRKLKHFSGYEVAAT